MKTNRNKLLIISHNVLDNENNVGKTLASITEKVCADDKYQLYFSQQLPSEHLCNKYFRITDYDVIKSLFIKDRLKIGSEVKIQANIKSKSVSKNILSKLYYIGNKRIPIISYLRDLIWKLKKWQNSNALCWVNKINPDVILFIPSDYEFAFRIVLNIMENSNARLITFFTDDCFYYKVNLNGFDRIRRRNLRNLGNQIIDKTDVLFTTGDKMSIEYKEVFGKDSFKLGNCVESDKICHMKTFGDTFNMVYVGNLHSNRWKSLFELSKVLDRVNGTLNYKKCVLNIYTGTKLSKKMSKFFNNSNSIKFHGYVNHNMVLDIERKSDLLIHVESFLIKDIRSTRLSVSTKLFEYMAVGIPIFAFGPKEIASMELLYENDLAIVANDTTELQEKITYILSNYLVLEKKINKAFRFLDSEYNKLSQTELIRDIIYKKRV